MTKRPKASGTNDSRSVVTIHDQTLERGSGGELHQVAGPDTPVMTTAQGGPISDDQNSLKVGARGPEEAHRTHDQQSPEGPVQSDFERVCHAAGPINRLHRNAGGGTQARQISTEAHPATAFPAVMERGFSTRA